VCDRKFYLMKADDAYVVGEIHTLQGFTA